VNRIDRIQPEFVDQIPRRLEPGKLYISIRYTTATHLCCCGCGSEVVTPLHPAQWSLTYDGETVSLDPSVGSWSLACQAHYFIRRNRVRWAARWDKSRIDAARARDRRDIAQHFSKTTAEPAPPRGPLRRLWDRLTKTRAR
jgi:hypothetical protein